MAEVLFKTPDAVWVDYDFGFRKVLGLALRRRPWSLFLARNLQRLASIRKGFVRVPMEVFDFKEEISDETIRESAAINRRPANVQEFIAFLDSFPFIHERLIPPKPKGWTFGFPPDFVIGTIVKCGHTRFSLVYSFDYWDKEESFEIKRLGNGAPETSLMLVVPVPILAVDGPAS